jgi:hypothetical protein
VIDLDSIKRINLKLSDFSYIRYIPLQTDENCLIGGVGKVLIRDNRIYVADYYKAFALFVFDLEGKFLFKIAQRGQGSNEYIDFRDFDIQNNGDIYILDGLRRKFLVFNSKGKHTHNIYADFFLFNFCLADDKMYWSKISDPGSAENVANLAIYDMTNETTELLFRDKKFLLGNRGYQFVPMIGFYKTPPDITYYSPRFSEIIYAIDKNGVRPAIGVKSKNLRKPPENVLMKWDKDAKKLKYPIKDDKIYFKENTGVYETDKYIMFKCINGPYAETKRIIYNKHSGEFMAFWDILLNINIRNDSTVGGSTGKYFFGVMNPDSDIDGYRQILNSHKEFKNWKEDDNPVIVLYDFNL